VERPRDDEYAAFYRGYVGLVTEPDLLAVLEAQTETLARLAARLPRNRETFRYREEKWSVREVLGHINDAERVFGYRAFCISRGDRTSLPGFSENDYVARADHDRRAAADHAAEFDHLRSGHLAFLRRLDDDQWKQLGEANGSPASVRALGFCMAGHLRHHLGVLSERYGVGLG
jgi:DinB superfamily